MSTNSVKQQPLWKNAPAIAAITVAVLFVIAGVWYSVDRFLPNRITAPRSLDITNYKTLAEKAAARLAYLTNGVNKDILALAAQSEVSATSSFAAAPNSSVKTADSAMRSFVLPAEVKKAAVDSERDRTVYSQEYEVQVGDYTSLPADQKTYYTPMGIPANSTYRERNMTSANYYKNTIDVDNKLYTAYIGTPNYSLEYLGGEYAIKSIYPEATYFSGYISNENTNPETEFLKAIIAGNAGYKQTGSQMINGVTYDVFESNQVDPIEPAVTDMSIRAPENNAKTVYLINQKTFELYQQKQYINNTLLTTRTLKKSEQINNADLNSLFVLNEVEIKEVQLPNYKFEAKQAEKIANEYGFIALSNDNLNNPIAFYANDLTPQGKMEELRYSKAFDPRNSSSMNIKPSKALASYSTGLIYATIYTEKPDINQYTYPLLDTSAYGSSSSSQASSSLSDSSVIINGVTVPAQTDGYRYIFAYNTYHWEVSLNSNEAANNKPLVLQTVLPSTVSELAKQTQRFQDTRPQIKPVEPKDLPKDAITLGSIPELVLHASSIPAVQTKNCYESKLIYGLYELPGCLMVGFDGYSYSYSSDNLMYTTQKSENGVTDVFRSVEVTILNARMGDIDLNDIQFYDYTSPKLQTVKVVQGNGFKTLVFPATNEVVLEQKLYVFEKEGNVFIISAHGFEENELKQLVENSGARKDIDTLQEQWKNSFGAKAIYY